MAERQMQYKLGLLQYYCSQQDTVSNPAIQLSKILPSAQYTEPDTRGRERYRAIPSDMDMTTCHPAISTTFSPILDQAIPTTPYPLDQAMPTISYPMLDQAMPPMSDAELDQGIDIDAHAKKTLIMRLVAIAVVLISALAFYLIWRPTSPASSLSVVTQQNASRISSKNNGTTTNVAVNSSGSIQIYILGAVRHPGVYTLPTDTRVYQLLQAAGGPLPNADLVALNLAAKLSDGQKIYVTAIGERPPLDLSTSNSGSSSTTSTQGQQLVNINTATAQEMEQQLHVSSKTAQTIINYREQHGPFTSVSQLLQVVSKSIYDKIKDSVTI